MLLVCMHGSVPQSSLGFSPEPEAGSLIWNDKAKELEMTAGHDTARI